MVLDSKCDGSDVTNPQSVRDYNCRDVVSRVRFLRRDDQVLLVILREPTDCRDTGRRLDGVGEIIISKTLSS